VRNSFRLSADTYYLEKPADVKSVTYTVTRKGDMKPVAEGVLNKSEYFYLGELLQLPALQTGEYLVSAAMTLNSGKTLGPVTTTFTKLDEAKAFAAWWGNNVGNAERVLKPFEPLRRDGQTVTLWGRTYRLNALALPEQITSQGRSLLAAQTRIVVTRDGKEIVIPLDGKLSFTDDKAWRIGFRGKAQGAGLSFKTTGTIEQDGLVKISLSYAPLGKAPVAVDALRLEFPVRADVAEGLLCVGPGGNFASLSHPLLPNKQGRLWSTLELGRKGSGMKVGSFYPDVWLGSEQRGLLWWADSDEGWVPDDAIPAHEAVRQGDAVVLRNNVIGRPFHLDQSRTFTFAYNATPFRPLVKGWRWRFTRKTVPSAVRTRSVRTQKPDGKSTDGTGLIRLRSIPPSGASCGLRSNQGPMPRCASGSLSTRPGRAISHPARHRFTHRCR
jgi:Glycoside hydrolase 123, N-terminal domain